MNISEIKVQYLPDFKPSERPLITKSSDAYKILLSQWDAGLMLFLEEFKIILLNNANRVLGIVNIAVGGRESVMVDMRVIFSIALKVSATKIILSHNHPSSTLTPSNVDIALTKRVVECGEILGITVHDHLIISNEGYYSFADDHKI